MSGHSLPRAAFHCGKKRDFIKIADIGLSVQKTCRPRLGSSRKRDGGLGVRRNRVQAMVKKLIISAIVLTVLIAGKEADAAGPAGLVRDFAASPSVQFEDAEGDLGAMDALDGYFDLFAEDAEMPA